MNSEYDRSVDAFVKASTPNDVPSDVQRRLRFQLEQFQRRLSEEGGHTRRPWPSVRAASWIVTGTLAASALALAFLLSLSNKPTWAEIVEAVQTRPWIHCVERTSRGQPTQFWYGLESGVAGSRMEDIVSYMDHRRKTEQRYVRKDNSVYVMPLNMNNTMPHYEAIFAAFTRPDDEISIPRVHGWHLVDQRVDRIREKTRFWLKYELKFQSIPSREMVYIFYVDPQTRLPKFWLRRLSDGTRQVFDIDYPPTGPADVYALGAPQHAKTMDRLPSRELTKILSDLQRACQQPEAYFAIVVDRDPDSSWDFANHIYRLWHRDRKWRIERAFFPDMLLWQNNHAQPAENVDRLQWWREQIRDVRFEPLFLSDGERDYTFKIRQNRKTYTTKEELRNASFSVTEVNPIVVRDDNIIPVSGIGFRLPEWESLQSIGRATVNRELSLNLDSKIGPPNMALVTAKGKEQTSRVWIDPQRAVAVRWEVQDNASAARRLPGMIRVGVVDQLSQSPHGYTYVSTYRTGEAQNAGSEQLLMHAVRDVYRDFGAEISDTVFEPSPKVELKETAAASVTEDQSESAFRDERADRLKQLGLALMRYKHAFGHLPPAHSTDETGRRLLSWRVLILPMLGYEGLYGQFHLEEPWNSEQNRKLIDKMPPEFASPKSGLYSRHMSNYLVPIGDNLAFTGREGLPIHEFTDGLSRTIAIVEVAPAHAVNWTKPQDLRVDLNDPFAGILKGNDDFAASFVDVSIHLFDRTMSPERLRAYFTRNGGESVRTPE